MVVLAIVADETGTMPRPSSFRGLILLPELDFENEPLGVGRPSEPWSCESEWRCGLCRNPGPDDLCGVTRSSSVFRSVTSRFLKSLAPECGLSRTADRSCSGLASTLRLDTSMLNLTFVCPMNTTRSFNFSTDVSKKLLFAFGAMGKSLSLLRDSRAVLPALSPRCAPRAYPYRGLPSLLWMLSADATRPGIEAALAVWSA
mmetsp:Transcript_20739/g.48486  ORF Transcript_20739/g.48486 Transcript_20739/m.48486 type:complete len:201 (-) Transcript_20739:521-1123(-)